MPRASLQEFPFPVWRGLSLGEGGGHRRAGARFLFSYVLEPLAGPSSPAGPRYLSPRLPTSAPKVSRLAIGTLGDLFRAVKKNMDQEAERSPCHAPEDNRNTSGFIQGQPTVPGGHGGHVTPPAPGGPHLRGHLSEGRDLTEGSLGEVRQRGEALGRGRAGRWCRYLKHFLGKTPAPGGPLPPLLGRLGIMRAACSCPRPQLGRDGCYCALLQHWGARGSGRVTVPRDGAAEVAFGPDLPLYPGEGCFFLMKSGP